MGNPYYLPPATDMSQPPPGYKPQPYEMSQSQNIDNDVQFVSGDADNSGDVEVKLFSFSIFLII